MTSPNLNVEPCKTGCKMEAKISHYDHMMPTFSSSGLLLQVEYAREASHNGSTAIGICGTSCVVLGVEKRMRCLEEERLKRRIYSLDAHVIMTFAGISADARTFIKRAQTECQSHRMIAEEAVTVQYITRYISNLKHKYTLGYDRRPFGVSCLIGGYDDKLHLYQTDPSGVYDEWKACSIGRYAGSVQAYLEKYYSDQTVGSDEGVIKLAVKSMMGGLRNGPHSFELSVLRRGKLVERLDEKTIKKYANIIALEKDEDPELPKLVNLCVAKGKKKSYFN